MVLLRATIVPVRGLGGGCGGKGETHMADNSRPLVLQMQEIGKSFSGVPVLKGVNLELYAGEVLALLGENGAGKSTLIKILNGDYQADSGQIKLNGRPVAFHSPRDAMAAGIRAVYQEFNNLPDLSVAENILLGALPKTRAGFVDWPAAWKKAQAVLADLHVELDPQRLVKDLTVGEQQLVEIAKSLSQEYASDSGAAAETPASPQGWQSRILIMDEPTAALSAKEVDTLFTIVRKMKQQGLAVIYISHRLEEVFRITDRVMVLRDGCNAGVLPTPEATPEKLVSLMLGGKRIESVADHQAQKTDRAAPPLLELRQLGVKNAFRNISFTLWPGEIVGIFGTLNSGVSSLLEALFGAIPLTAGEILMDGRRVPINNPQDAKKAGLALIPSDRKIQGLVLDASVAHNITGANIPFYTRFGFLQLQKERQRVQTWFQRLGIRCAGGVHQAVRSLSGGNQQKTVFARWLDTAPRILLCHEPTRGVDVGAKVDLYQALTDLKHQKLGIIMASTDLHEILSMSDRILVLRDGVQAAEFNHGEATGEKLMLAALGGIV